MLIDLSVNIRVSDVILFSVYIIVRKINYTQKVSGENFSECLRRTEKNGLQGRCHIGGKDYTCERARRGSEEG